VKFSIVTPAFNSDRFIAETIESIISQRGDFEIEYVVVDGGSTDGTMAIVRSYQEAVAGGTFRLHCKSVVMRSISEPDTGMYDAIAKGFASISGDVVAYLNSDDTYAPNAFAVVKLVLESLPRVDWITGHQTLCNEQGVIVDSYLPFFYPNAFIRKGLFNGRTLPFLQQEPTFFRRSLLARVDLEAFRRYKLAGDGFLWNTFARHASLYVVNAVLAGYRMHQANLARNFMDKYLDEFGSFADRGGLGWRERLLLALYWVVWRWRLDRLTVYHNPRIVPWDAVSRQFDFGKAGEFSNIDYMIPPWIYLKWIGHLAKRCFAR
jgi:glycosyltransferase involved in cell wall biosynthesis